MKVEKEKLPHLCDTVDSITPDSVFDDFIDGMEDRLTDAMINTLEYIGETCLSEARLNGNYRDRTGNLRNSIGYVVVMDGKIIREAGGDAGRKFARDMAREFPKGLVLIMATGMNYSSYVAARGYNVIDSAEDMALRLVPRLMRELGFEIAA